MCHQFKLPTLAEISKYLKSDLNLPLSKPNFTVKNSDIFPGKTAPILLFTDNKLQLIPMTWGFASPKGNNLLFNARIERFYDSRPSMWDKSFARKRCIIIASEFYEYSSEKYQAQNNKSYHKKYSFADANNPFTLIAGIYDQKHFAMVTTNPNSSMKPIHNRMPLVIKPDELRKWLFQNFTSLIDRQNFDLKVSALSQK